MQGRQIINTDHQLLLSRFKQWLVRQNYAKATIAGKMIHLRYFLQWMEYESIGSLSAITKDQLHRYNTHLHTRPVSIKTIQDHLGILKHLNHYLKNHGEAPIVQVTLRVKDKQTITYQRPILTPEQIRSLYESCATTIWGLRDRVILSLYYGCGLRSKEGAHVRVEDLDFKQDLLHVRAGKNNTERYVPMSRAVQKDIQTWLEGGHAWFSGKPSPYLLTNYQGKQARNPWMNERLTKLCEQAGINQRITLHSLRHSIATHLLHSGMSLESIRQFLGHKSLETTKIYTHILSEYDRTRSIGAD